MKTAHYRNTRVKRGMRWPIGIERHPGFIGQLRTQVHSECEEPARENIAHNTLPYKFAWMLPLPQI